MFCTLCHDNLLAECQNLVSTNCWWTGPAISTNSNKSEDQESHEFHPLHSAIVVSAISDPSLAPGIPCEAEQEASRLVLVLLEQLLALLLGAAAGAAAGAIWHCTCGTCGPVDRGSGASASAKWYLPVWCHAMPCHGMLCYDIKRDLWIHGLLKNFSCPQNLCHWSKNNPRHCLCRVGLAPSSFWLKTVHAGPWSVSVLQWHTNWSLTASYKLQVWWTTSITTNTAWCVITLVLQQDLNCPPTAPSGLDKAFARPLAGDSPKDIHLGGACLTSTGL